jgi:spore coat protein U-like protein
MKKLIISLFIMALGISLSGAAYGGTETATLDVSVNKVVACTVSTTAVNFGDTDGTTMLYADGDVTVNCTPGAPYNIALDAGQNYDTALGRILSYGVNTISYGLTQDPGYQTQWGDSDFANTFDEGSSLADTGDGTDQPHTVYGYVGTGNNVPAGTYTDVVTVTVYY